MGRARVVFAKAMVSDIGEGGTCAGRERQDEQNDGEKESGLEARRNGISSLHELTERLQSIVHCWVRFLSGDG